MASRKKATRVLKKLTQPVSETGARPAARVSRGRTHPGGASFPVAPPRSDLPRGYSKTFGEIEQRILQERLRVVLAANTAKVLLYWDIGGMILDRLAADLHEAFPNMQGFSPRNLEYMRGFAVAWPDRAIVQEVLAQIAWYSNVTLIEKLGAEADPYLFDFLGTADARRENDVGQALLDHIQRFLLGLGSGFTFIGRQVAANLKALGMARIEYTGRETKHAA